MLTHNACQRGACARSMVQWPQQNPNACYAGVLFDGVRWGNTTITLS